MDFLVPCLFSSKKHLLNKTDKPRDFGGHGHGLVEGNIIGLPSILKSIRLESDSPHVPRPHEVQISHVPLLQVVLKNFTNHGGFEKKNH